MRTRKILVTEIQRTSGRIVALTNRIEEYEQHLTELRRLLATLDEPAEPEIDDGPFALCPHSTSDLAEGSIAAQIVKFLGDNPDRAWSVRQVATGLLISDREAVSFALTDLYHARLVERRRGRGCFQYRLVRPEPVQEGATV